MTHNNPPIARYRLTLTVEGNSGSELQDLLHVESVNYAYQHAVHQREADETQTQFHIDVQGGFRHLVVEEMNSQMNPDKYEAELAQWWAQIKGSRAL